MFVCQSCGDHTSDSFRQYYYHLRYFHELVNNLNVTCNINGCKSQYKVLNSFQKHIRRKHKEFYKEHVTNVDDNDAEQNDLEDNIFDVNDESNILDDDGDMGEYMPHEIDYEKIVAMFLLDLRENKKASGVACSFVANSMINIVNLAFQHKIDKVASKLSSMGIIDLELDEIVKEKEIYITNALRKFSLMKTLDSYVERNDNHVAPVQYTLNANHVNNKLQTYQYVPINKTLTTLCKNDDVIGHILSPYFSPHIESFYDGSVFKNNSLFKNKQSALQINLYCDEFVPVNKLSNKVKKHKITAFYFTLGNLPRKFRTRLKDINLVLLCPSSYVSMYGYSEIVKPLLYDIKLLETEGIYLENHDITLYGTISLLIGDNLGAHGLGGFLECFSPLVKKVCRFCNGTQEEINHYFKEEYFEKRTVDMYNEHASIVEQHPQYSSVYGLKKSSPFNELSHFHVIDRQPGDIYHDVYEGVAIDVLSSSVSTFVRSGFFDLAMLNQRINEFSYADFEKTDKPQNIHKTGTWATFRIKQQAIEMSNLLRLFPLLVGDLVPLGNENWKLLIEFIQIVQVMTCPVFTVGATHYLADLIEDFFSSYVDMYNTSIKPKGHNMVHYPLQILLCGPPIDHGTIRFEGKHHYFTEVYNRSKNRVNVCRSMAKRHQFCMFINHEEGFLLDPDEPKTIFSKVIKVSTLHASIKLLIESVTTDENLSTSKGIIFDGLHYRVNNAVALSFESDVLLFGRIEILFIHNNILHIVYEKLDNVEFSFHYNSYKVAKVGQFGICTLPEILDVNPLGMYTLPNYPDLFMIPLKYRIWNLENN